MNKIERICPTPIVSAPGPVGIRVRVRVRGIREFHTFSKDF